MDLKWKGGVETDALLKDRDGQCWGYIRAETMQKRYPNGGYLIMADVRKGRESKRSGYLYDGEKKLALYPYAAKSKRRLKCVGYIPVENKDESADKGADGGAEAFARIVKRDRKRGILLFLLLLLLLLGGLYYWMHQKTPPNLDENAISYHVDGLKNRDPSQISIPVFAAFEADAGDMEVKANMANPEGNPAYFEYHVTLKDTGEEIFKSGLIKPGMALPGFTIDKALEPGEYTATVSVKCFDLDDYTKEMNGGAMDVRITIKGE